MVVGVQWWNFHWIFKEWDLRSNVNPSFPYFSVHNWNSVTKYLKTKCQFFSPINGDWIWNIFVPKRSTATTRLRDRKFDVLFPFHVFACLFLLYVKYEKDDIIFPLNRNDKAEGMLEKALGSYFKVVRSIIIYFFIPSVINSWISLLRIWASIGSSLYFNEILLVKFTRTCKSECGDQQSGQIVQITGTCFNFWEFTWGLRLSVKHIKLIGIACFLCVITF